jgi:hypothetical protein
MRSIGAMVFCIPLALGAAHGVAATGSSPSPSGCEARPQGNDALQVTCPLGRSASVQRFRFTANFSGGHDDTTASMTPTLDGASLACEPGSKTSLIGEDGDVSVDCAFTVGEAPGTTRVLQVLLKWRHAQYTDFSLVAR